MRTAGMVFVILGGLALAIQGFVAANAENTNVIDRAVSMPVVVSGIVVTAGLLMLALARRGEVDSRKNPRGGFTPS